MPKTIPLVSELSPVAYNEKLILLSDGRMFYRDWLDQRKSANEIPGAIILSGNRVKGHIWFEDKDVPMLLSLMDNFGKVEEAKHWKALYSLKVNGTPQASHMSQCLLELRSRIEALEGKEGKDYV